MSQLLVEQLAKSLDLPAEDVSSAYADLLTQLNDELERTQMARIPGLGMFVVKGGELRFEADDSLSMAVNNRFGLLDDETVSIGLGGPDFVLSSEADEESDEIEVDQSVIDQILAEDLPETTAFSAPPPEGAENEISDDVDLISSFDEDFFNSGPDQSDQPSLNTSEVPTQEKSAPEDVSMKENDPNSTSPSDQDSNDFDTEWSPFFEELEGEEFDIDNTIDLSAEDWQNEIPSPPSSPFASSDSSEGDADDLYFDVDADPDDTLFSPASMDVDDPSDTDSSWASAPLDEASGFFENDQALGSSFSEEVDGISALSGEDEFFSPVSGSADNMPDDTLFSADTIYSEEETVEADDTIFLAPDQTVKSNTADAAPGGGMFAPPAMPADETIAEDRPPETPKSRNPYAYREERKKNKSAWPWVIGVLAILGLVAGVGSYFMGLPPFGSSSNTPADPPIATIDPLPTPVDPPATDPSLSQNTTPTPDPSTTDPVTTETPTTTQTPPPAPAIQRIGIDRSRGGWTIVVSSELQRSDAERIADNFAQTFEALRFPIDILTTDQFTNTRHRVGVGQFDTRQEANAILQKFDTDLPTDAWLLRIE